jgi:hypothetical protein
LNVRKAVLGSIVGLGLFASGMLVAQGPERDVSRFRHPNIAAAQRFVQQAYDKIVAAQQANEWDLNGHAQKAKDLLDQASRELKEAAETANHHR